VTQAYDRGDFDGVGFVFSRTDDFFGVDLDHVRDPASGEISVEAHAIILELDSYTEVSVSGAGLHIYGRVKLPSGGRRRGCIELYDEGRYFCVTGHRVDGTPEIIHARTAQIARFHTKTFGVLQTSSNSRTRSLGAELVFGGSEKVLALSHSGSAMPQPSADDTKVLDCLREALGEKFSDLYDLGTWQKYYPTQSEGDLALLGMLARVASGDRIRMDQMFQLRRWGNAISGAGVETIASVRSREL
jgi:putative DNA primase/helicase